MRPAYEVPMTTETQAFGRLKAFIIDWSARWHDAREGNVTQEQWAREMDIVSSVSPMVSGTK